MANIFGANVEDGLMRCELGGLEYTAVLYRQRSRKPKNADFTLTQFYNSTRYQQLNQIPNLRKVIRTFVIMLKYNIT